MTTSRGARPTPAALQAARDRAGFDRPHATIGVQPVGLAGAALWVLPNPSGLNAHYTLDGLAAHFAAVRQAAGYPHAVAAGGS